MTRLATRLLLIAALAVAGLTVTSGVASAKTPCGVKVIDDWYGSKSGRLRKTYPLHCYRDALKIVNERQDILTYSNAGQDILLALQQAIAGGRGPKGGGGFLASVYTADALPSFVGGPYAKDGGHPPTGDQPYTIRSPGSGPGPVGNALKASSASSVPLPAIVLGAIAVLLLSLGAAAHLARRRHSRRSVIQPQKP